MAQNEKTKFNTYALIPELMLSRRLDLGVCHQPEVNLGWFQSRLGVFRVSSHTEELWYNETDCGW